MCIEQLLVDIVAEKSFKNLYSRNELQGVYNLADKSYLIDYARLLRYARRRGKADEVKKYLGGYAVLTQDNFTKENIERLQKISGNDPSLLEKTVYAFGLLD